MRIFISHASKNSEVVLRFADFLESISNELEVFCSSEKRSIKVGQDFVHTIFGELDKCNIFLPIISAEYYASKFCMIELGVAYSYFYRKYQKKGEEYIFPFVLYPLQKSEALAGTPMATLQVGELSSEEDIHSFLECIKEGKGLYIETGINRKIHAFRYNMDQILLQELNIVDLARINVYFDDSVYYEKKEDIVNYSIIDRSVITNFNMNPYEKQDSKYPNFVSMVFRYVDKLNLERYLDFNENATFQFILTNFTNSLQEICVEFKYSDNHIILEKYNFSVEYGENMINIPLTSMRSKALSEISEICFVVCPENVVEDEGMFKISSVEVG